MSKSQDDNNKLLNFYKRLIESCLISTQDQTSQEAFGFLFESFKVMKPAYLEAGYSMETLIIIENKINRVPNW
jgi:hypothetical protein